MTTADDFMRMAMSDEPLDPALQPFVIDHPTFGQVLKHPLVVETFFRPGIANHAYRVKTKELAKAKEERRWHSYVFIHERPYRLWAFQQIQHQITDDEEFWHLLGRIWTDSENIWQNVDEWLDLLASDRPGREHMMDEDEREALAALPDPITVWRGCQREINEDGLSWTTNQDRARWFARRWSDDDRLPVVYEGTVPKDKVVALFHGRNEDEIVVADFYSVAVTKAEEL